MSAALAIPVKLNDLVVDVAMVSPAQGHLPYFNAANKLTNLAPGSAGQFFTTGGAGADPAWSDTLSRQLRCAFLGSAVNDVTQDALRVHPSGALGANWRPIAVYASSGATTPVFAVLSGGGILLGGSGATAQLNCTTDGANVFITPSAASVGTAFIRSNKFGGTVYDATSSQFLDLSSNTVELRSRASTGSTTSAAILLNTATNVTLAQAVLLAVQNLSVDVFRIDGNGDTRPYGALIGSKLTTGTGSNTLYRNVCELRPEWIIANNNTRTGRMRLFAHDFTGTDREGFRLDSDGTQPLISFYGAAAIAKPAPTGSRGGNAALASLLTALANLGLITDSTSA